MARIVMPNAMRIAVGVALLVICCALTVPRGSAQPALPTPASPLYCPLEPSSLTQTIFIGPCLMSLNRRLAAAVRTGSTDLASTVPEAAQFFLPGAAHLDAGKWKQALDHLEKKLRKPVVSQQFYSVMNKNVTAPGTDSKHHYYSLAPYYWPNTTSPDGLPYILRDGFVNPEADAVGDQKEFTHLADDVYMLAIGYYLLADEAYAVRALTLLDKWYVDPDWSMIPAVDHAQVRRGYDDDYGQPTGLIEFIKHTQIIDAFAMLNHSITFRDPATGPFHQGMQSWFAQYHFWLTNSTLGQMEHTSANNHHTYYNIQAAMVAAFTRDYTAVVGFLNEVPHLLATQTTMDGSEPLELTRTNSWHYSCYNLQALCILATISQHLTDSQMVPTAEYGALPDLIGYSVDGPELNSGRNILGVMNYLVPYAEPMSLLPPGSPPGPQWNLTHLQNFTVKPQELVSSIRLFASIFENPYYLDRRPSWAVQNYSYPYTSIADTLSPLIATAIDWVLTAPQSEVTLGPTPSDDSNPSFALLISLFKDYFPFFLPIGVIGVYRWSSFLIRAFGALLFLMKSTWSPKYVKPRVYSPRRDATLIIPTIDHGPELKDGLTSWLANYPAKVIFVTSIEVAPLLSALVEETHAEFKRAELDRLSANLENPSKATSKEARLAQRVAAGKEAPPARGTEIQVLTVEAPNKRKQMVRGLTHVTTDIVVFTDDDAIWPPECLEQMVACFDNPAIGGVGTEQRMRPCDPEVGPNFWEVLADLRLTAKSIENAAACQFGNSVTCLSGRTAAYRTCCFKPTVMRGQYNPHSNRMFGADAVGHAQYDYLPTSMLRRLARRDQAEQNLPSDALTREEIRELCRPVGKGPDFDAAGGVGAGVDDELAGYDDEEDVDEDPFPFAGSMEDNSIALSTAAQHQARIATTSMSSSSPLSAKSSLLSPKGAAGSNVHSSPGSAIRNLGHGMRGRSTSLDDSYATVSPASNHQLYLNFCHAFLNDYFYNVLPWAFGQYHLHSGDDKFLTRYITTRGWQMHVQIGQKSCIYTTFKPNWMFLKQYMRWTRNTWRSDFRSLFVDRSVWCSTDYLFLVFLMLDKFVSPITLLVGPFLIGYLCLHSSTGLYATPHDREHSYRLPLWNILCSYSVWLMFSRFVRLFPHFIARPSHVRYLPGFVAFQYLLAPIKIYCLFTLHVVEWGTRKMNGDPLEEPLLSEEEQQAIAQGTIGGKSITSSDDATSSPSPV